MLINLDLNIDNKEFTFETEENLNVNMPHVVYTSGTFKLFNSTSKALPIEHGLGRTPKLFWITAERKYTVSNRYYAGQYYNSAQMMWKDYKNTPINQIFVYPSYAASSTSNTLYSTIETAADEINIYATPVFDYPISAEVTYSWGAIYWDD